MKLFILINLINNLECNLLQSIYCNAPEESADCENICFEKYKICAGNCNEDDTCLASCNREFVNCNNGMVLIIIIIIS